MGDVFGKGDAPPAPDYAAAARATAQGNLEATRAATKANRINQYTPYGTLTYSQKPTGEYDYAAYNAAVNEYNRAMASGGGGTPGPIGDGGKLWGAQNATNFGRSGSAIGGGGVGLAPRLENFMKYDPDSGWEQRVQLTPEAQAALDQQLALNRKYGETANVGFDRVRELFENPQLDTSLLPERAINVGQTAQEAILSRLNPQLQQQDEQLRARLANQGIGLGSTAYQRELAMQGQRANDLQMQAALQGINLDQANRAAALQEQAYLQDRPLNLINALRTGNQVTNPQFQQFAQQQAVGGPNMLGAAQAQYGAQLDAYNAQQAQNGGLAGGLFSIGGAALGGLMGGGIQGAQLGAGLGGAFGRALF